MEPPHQSTVIALVLVVGVLLWRLLRIGSRPSDIPPGPPTLPIIGNLHQIPKQNKHVFYQQCAKQYGPIFSLMLGQSVHIVLADGWVIRELVDARGKMYADRPDLWVRQLFDHSRIIMRGYDDLWRVERKLYHALLNISKAKRYLPYQELETLKVLVDMMHDPADFVAILGRGTASISTSITYGVRLADKDSPQAHRAMENSHGFFGVVVQSQLLDQFPSLRPLIQLIPNRWNPLARKALEAYAKERAFFKEYYEIGLSGDQPCFAKDIAASQKSWQGTTDGDLLTDHAASYIAGISFEGGADTTRYTLHGFIKAMLLFPDVQRRSQAAIDAVVGEEEIPSSKHLPELPFVNALAKETVRWMPTAISGAIPHRNQETDHYRGFRIPKGSVINLGVWSAHCDETQFPDARSFIPERHNAETSLFESTSAHTPKDRGQFGFGAGRRMCPGMHVASNTLLLAIARLVWAFDVTPSLDSNGNPTPVDRDAFVGGLAAMPAPFKCEIKPRSAARAALIEREWAALTKAYLREDGNYRVNPLSS